LAGKNDEGESLADGDVVEREWQVRIDGWTKKVHAANPHDALKLANNSYQKSSRPSKVPEIISVSSQSGIRSFWKHPYVFEKYAYPVKVFVQMGIGVATIGFVFFHLWSNQNLEAEQILRNLFLTTAVGLGLAAAVELAYTLFTPGPDEAIEPLLLGVSATLLFLVSGAKETPKAPEIALILSLSIVLVGLFAVRRFLLSRD
jgi:hypothetical protein